MYNSYLSGGDPAFASATTSETDSITVEIHDGTTGDIIGSPVKTILMTNGTASATFPALTGSHYIVVKHRSAMETWSDTTVAMSATATHNFTTSAGRAYGSNQVYVGGGKYGMWNGDVNQDGVIESGDYTQMESDVLSILFGYYVTDLTGDGIVESADYTLMEQNVLTIIFVARPF